MSCHQAEGQGIPGMFPAIAGSSVVTGSMDKHIDTVMNGVDGTMMSPFTGALSDADIAAVITYQRNAFGNATGEVLQPVHVRSLRDGLGIKAPSSVASAADTILNEGGVN
jgi:cytochrome c oxidase subunit 2